MVLLFGAPGQMRATLAIDKVEDTSSRMQKYALLTMCGKLHETATQIVFPSSVSYVEGDGSEAAAHR